MVSYTCQGSEFLRLLFVNSRNAPTHTSVSSHPMMQGGKVKKNEVDPLFENVLQAAIADGRVDVDFSSQIVAQLESLSLSMVEEQLSSSNDGGEEGLKKKKRSKNAGSERGEQEDLEKKAQQDSIKHTLSILTQTLLTATMTSDSTLGLPTAMQTFVGPTSPVGMQMVMKIRDQANGFAKKADTNSNRVMQQDGLLAQITVCRQEAWDGLVEALNMLQAEMAISSKLLSNPEQESISPDI